VNRPLPRADIEQVFAKTEKHWETLRGKRIFLTGASGFFGTWLIESFLEAETRLKLGARLVLLTRDAEKLKSRKPEWFAKAALDSLEILSGDIASFEFPKGEFSHLVHGAALTSQASSPQEHLAIYRSIVAGTERVLELASRSRACRLLYLSSGAAYGRQPPELPLMNENHPGAPRADDWRAAYGHAKRVSEFLIASQTATSGMEHVNARCFAFVGPGLPLDAHYAIGNFIGDALAQRPIQIKGDGTPYRSYLYAGDLAAWLWRLLLDPRATGTVNVGSDQPVSIAETAQAVAAAAARVGLKTEVRVLGQPTAGKLAERYVPSVTKARSEFGLDTWTDLSTAIERTLAWHHPI
jgi:dTDP-glucose 4,6-dehydratase